MVLGTWVLEEKEKERVNEKFLNEISDPTCGLLAAHVWGLRDKI